uniref:Uncharacterized protein n=1 Tax=Leptobrachium leishanense TaxID=445787 RepID=A0A8C5PUQ6_9ANUR
MYTLTHTAALSGCNVCVCIYIHTHTHTYIYIHIHTHCSPVHTYIHIAALCVYIQCVCMYIYTHTHRHRDLVNTEISRDCAWGLPNERPLEDFAGGARWKVRNAPSCWGLSECR